MTTARYYTIKTKRRKVKASRLIFLLALCAFLLSMFFSVRFLGALNAIQDQSDWAAALPAAEKDTAENILVYSVSDSDNVGSVTSLVLATYHPGDNRFRGINIPVETLLDAHEFGFIRLSQLYSEVGREQFITLVSEFFSTPIHTYFEVNEAFLPSALDILGADIQSELHIANSGDIFTIIHADGITTGEQLQRRQAVLTLLAKQLLDTNVIKKLPTLLRISPLIRTNMSWRKLVSTMEAFKASTFSETVSLIDLPGEEQVQADGPFWFTDPQQLPTLTQWLTDINEETPKVQVSLEVLNGCGVSGLAGRVAQMLRDSGYNVVHVGNADHYNYDVTQVISRTQDINLAKDVAVLLPNAQFLKEESPGSNVYVTVIVGKNYIEE
jgi:anionic cell wall polymer biosynthesis LytR-Cps2A-Psr (LCP) family protein